MSPPSPPPDQPPGPGVDAFGRAVIDPTANVLQLVDAAVRRLDDLRASDNTWLQKLNTMRDAHAMELREAESARIDAVRAIDVGAVQQASQVAATAASTLAAQVATSAETLRTQVAAAASAATIALSAALEPVQKDIADLRRAQYEAQGQKTQVVETHAKASANGTWIGLAIAGATLMITFMLGILGIGITLLMRSP